MNIVYTHTMLIILLNILLNILLGILLSVCRRLYKHRCPRGCTAPARRTIAP